MYKLLTSNSWRTPGTNWKWNEGGNASVWSWMVAARRYTLCRPQLRLGDARQLDDKDLRSLAQPAGPGPDICAFLPAPATIVNSTHVAGIPLSGKLERYIRVWIDALCIIQDSPEDKVEQINAIESLSSHNFLVALPGLREAIIDMQSGWNTHSTIKCALFPPCIHDEFG